MSYEDLRAFAERFKTKVGGSKLDREREGVQYVYQYTLYSLRYVMTILLNFQLLLKEQLPEKSCLPTITLCYFSVLLLSM